MASRHEIVSIDFRANAGKANPAMESLRVSADAANKKITELKANLAKGGTEKQIEEWNKQLKEQKKTYQALINAQQNLIKGVGTLNQAIEAFNNGSLEKMSAKFQKTAKNALELQKTQLNPQSATYKHDLEELEALSTRLDENMAKMRLHTDDLIATIRAGGKVSEQELTQEIRGLEDLLKLIPRGTEEYKQYDTQLKAIQGHVTTLSETERRLAGEVTTVADAMNMASIASREIAETEAARAKNEMEFQTARRTGYEKWVNEEKALLTATQQELKTTDEELTKQRELKGVLEGAAEIRERLTKATNERAVAARDEYQELNKLLEVQNEQKQAEEKYNEAREKLAGTGNLKEQLKLREDVKQAEEDLLQVMIKVEEQEKKLAGARDVARGKIEKVTKVEEELTKAMGGRNYDDELSKLNRLESEHAELTENLRVQTDAYNRYSAAAKEAADLETKAAIEMAQAQNYSQKSLEDSIAILERQNKIETDPKKSKEQAEAIATLTQKLKEATGEWMSFAEAEKLAGKVGASDFIATQQQLQQAMASVQREIDKTKISIQQKADAEVKDEKAIDTEKAKLKQLEQQLKDLKFEQDNFNMSHERMDQLLKQPTSAENLDELKAAIKRAEDELHRLQNSLGSNKKEAEEFAKQIKGAKVALGEMEKQSKATSSAFEKAWSRLKTYIGLYMGAAVVIRKLTQAMGDLLELSDKMGEVRKTTGFTAEEVGRLSENLKRLDTRSTLVQLLDLSAAAGQLGLKTEQDVQGFAEAANKLMVALPEMGREASTQLLKVALATGEIDKIRKQMDEGLVSGSSAVAVAMEKVGSTIDRLRASSASAAPAITDFVQRVGAVGAQSGISIDQIAALGSTVDALGMRVEMSATALSRMIPAIRNNAFDIAKAIGVTPETLRNLFDTGRGMEAILMIFQHIKDTGKDAEGIEQMLGTGNMQAIMKDLNQMGARAGIVFSGLSQNVDELRRQLGVAREAYEENIAVQQEYDRMNETTAAKWARLKNEMSELFTNDTAQKVLGGIIDSLRKIVDFLTGSTKWGGKIVSAVLLPIATALAVIKRNLGGVLDGAGKTFSELRKGFKEILTNTRELIVYRRRLKQATNAQTRATIEAEMAQKGLNKAMVANLWFAVAAAVLVLASRLWSYYKAAKAASLEAARFNDELNRETEKLDKLVDSTAKASVKMEEANKKVQEATKVRDEAKAGLDGSAESTEKLTKAESDLIVAEEQLRSAQAKHAASIDQINTEYGQYLGFILSEVSSEKELAAARELANDKLREGIKLRQKQAIEEQEREKTSKKVDRAYANLDKFVSEKALPETAARIMIEISKAAMQNNYTGRDDFKKAVFDMLQQQTTSSQTTAWGIAEKAAEYYEQLEKTNKNIKKRTKKVNDELTAAREESQKDLSRQYELAIENYEDLQQKFAAATGDARKQAAADLLKQMDTINGLVKNAGNFYNMEDNDEKVSYEAFVKNSAERVKGMKEVRKALLKEAGNAYKSKNPDERTSPWGTPLPGSSTDWKNMTAEQLVARRKQMRDFVNAIQTDTDVKAVLEEDAALKKAIEGGMSADMRTVIEWYNTERLKIQKELYDRHLTNTGDWRDPKNGGFAWQKQLKIDFDTYLKILDAYYTERKAHIQEERNDEMISEEEAWLREIENEAEWRQRRMELQQIYQGRSAEIAEDERNAIYAILAEQDKDTVEMVEKTIGVSLERLVLLAEKDEVRFSRIMSGLTKGIATDMLKQKNALGKQLKAIEEIINKERPFNGIADNLRENLVKMGILTADLGPDQRSVAEETKRTMWLLGQSEKAYTLTIEELMRRMADAGLSAWADELNTNENGDAMKQALLAQLRTAYDAVQDAIKKEANQIKRQVEIQWNDAVLPGGQSMKGAFEATLSALGLREDSVKRANSLIGGGTASERVADRLAIQQMRVRLAMQQQYFNLVRKIADERIAQSEAAGKLEDAAHQRRSRDLALAEEQKKIDEQRVTIANQLEESQNRLYKEMRAYADLIASSLQSVFEAANTGNAEYYNELAKLGLTGKGGPGAGKYIVIEHEGTSEAKAHYEYLSERDALERQHEIERENAMADAWKKVMDDINAKMSEAITDQLNAMLQSQSLDANTQAILNNTNALLGLTQAESQRANGSTSPQAGGLTQAESQRANGSTSPQAGGLTPDDTREWLEGMGDNPMMFWTELSDKATKNMRANNEEIAASTQSMFAKMTQAANLYGVAYQAMSNDNLSATQKWEMIALQSVGNYAISSLTATMSEAIAKGAVNEATVLGKLWSQLGWAAAPVFAIFTGLLGAAMGAATSKVAKSKSQIAQATGASNNAGRLAMGMLTYAEGNVNEFTDPRSLQEGRSYNVDAADGRTYRARYMGRNVRTHLTNGPEFHLSGERGREMIIDAGTTRQITMNDGAIWRAIQTLSAGNRNRLRLGVRRGRGVAAFADGNVEELADMGAVGSAGAMSAADVEAMRLALDRSSAIQEALLARLAQPFEAFVSPYGKRGIVHGYDQYKKEAQRYGQDYLD